MSRLLWHLTKAIPFLISIGLQVPKALPQAQQKTVQEQSDFGSDSDLDRKVPTPRSAMEAIRTESHSNADELSDDMFETSEIHLNGPAEVDLIVLIHVGSHAARFILLRPTSSGYSIVLDSGGDSLAVLRTRSNGYRNVAVGGITQAGRFTTVASYKFDGRRYIRASEKTKRAN